jgi:hypothetical protein
MVPTMKTSFLTGLAFPGFAFADCSSPAAAGDNVIVTSPKRQRTQVVVTDKGTFTALITQKQGNLKLWRKGLLARGYPRTDREPILAV